mmetsp:Transcript_45161/g.98199  ORF Transcript_45161/g.98199 Transcript_45161/m.98199 type:complete len:206 (-) Transcript_45161:1252-1869(-)
MGLQHVMRHLKRILVRRLEQAPNAGKIHSPGTLVSALAFPHPNVGQEGPRGNLGDRKHCTNMRDLRFMTSSITGKVKILKLIPQATPMPMALPSVFQTITSFRPCAPGTGKIGLVVLYASLCKPATVPTARPRTAPSTNTMTTSSHRGGCGISPRVYSLNSGSVGPSSGITSVGAKERLVTSQAPVKPIVLRTRETMSMTVLPTT